MSADWQAGDRALCVRDGNGPSPNGGERAPPRDVPEIVARCIMPRVGTTWTVSCVVGHDSPEEGPLLYLGLTEVGADLFFDARLFTKLREHQADSDDRETIRLLKRKPVEVE